jgi:hypothetical protein
MNTANKTFGTRQPYMAQYIFCVLLTISFDIHIHTVLFTKMCGIMLWHIVSMTFVMETAMTFWYFLYFHIRNYASFA